MAYLDSNEPYQRIDDKVWYGLGIGAGAGLVTGGGTILAAKLAHDRIPKKAERKREELNDERQSLQNKIQKAQSSYSPIEYVKSKFGGPQGELEAHASMLNRTENKRRKYQSKIDRIQEEMNHKWSHDAVRARQSRSLYNRHMSGWGRKAGIAGIATGIGAGVGALTGWLMSESERQQNE